MDPEASTTIPPHSTSSRRRQPHYYRPDADAEIAGSSSRRGASSRHHDRHRDGRDSRDRHSSRDDALTNSSRRMANRREGSRSDKSKSTYADPREDLEEERPVFIRKEEERPVFIRKEDERPVFVRKKDVSSKSHRSREKDGRVDRDRDRNRHHSRDSDRDSSRDRNRYDDRQAEKSRRSGKDRSAERRGSDRDNRYKKDKRYAEMAEHYSSDEEEEISGVDDFDDDDEDESDVEREFEESDSSEEIDGGDELDDMEGSDYEDFEEEYGDGEENSDLEEIQKGEMANERSNSPELNPIHNACSHADVAGGGAGGDEDLMIVPHSNTRQQSQDPPSFSELRNPRSSPRSPPPADSNMLVDVSSLEPADNQLDMNAPPTPAAGERNRRVATKYYGNYTLDEEGFNQYRQQQQNQMDQMKKLEQLPPSGEIMAPPITGITGGNVSDLEDDVSRLTFHGHDPPELGHDPPEHAMSNDPPSSAVYQPETTHRSVHRGSRSRSSRNKDAKDKKETFTSSSSSKKKPEKKKPEIKGILKKKEGAPPPIAYFGKPVSPPPPGTHEEDFEGEGSISSGSDPSVSEEKHVSSSKRDYDDDLKSVRSTNTKSGMRVGRYAAANAAAAANLKKSESDRSMEAVGEESGEDNNSNSSSNNDVKIKPSLDNSDHDDHAIKAITVNDDERFDRTRSHFLRTSDLGLTQDTIFPEQFLENPSMKAEPHYHHPSPHPPPGVQFHIDENWICVDDGKGGHSPIAPQAVDALVAMGYRAACDPMMWTPTTKTRKYMTEKGLRFDDIPIPGPLDEGEGSASDSTCLVWNGKFPHKYHGSELPAIRSQGIVNMSPEELVDLLMDSSRVNEYNKSSKGRMDEVVLSDGKDLDSCPFSGRRKKKLTGVVMEGSRVVDGVAVMDSETDDEKSDAASTDVEVEEHVFDDSGNRSVRTFTTRGSSSSTRRRKESKFVGVTKLIRSTNKPPFVRKNLEFVTLLHCRALTDEQGANGFIIVGRAVTPAQDAEKGSKGVMRSEVLLQVHIIRRLQNKRRHDKGKGSSSKSVVSSASGRKASKSDLANRCLVINVNHLKSPLIPNMLAKKVGMSAAVNFIMDIRALTE